MRADENVSITKLILAFASTYFIWGSTYLAIRYAIQTLPGFLMAATRFLIAGAVLCAWSRWRGARLTGLHPWRATSYTDITPQTPLDQLPACTFIQVLAADLCEQVELPP